MNDDYLTIGQAAEEFGLSRVKVWRWIKAGDLVAHQSGRDRRERLVRRADIAALLQPSPVPIDAYRGAAKKAVA